MNLIDFQDPRPIYEQITEQYKLMILKGIVLPGEQMPSVRKLAMELSANPNTVQRAYAELERQGFIYTVKGRGSFVSGSISLKDQRRTELLNRLRALLKEAADIGIDADELLREVSAGDGSIAGTSAAGDGSIASTSATGDGSLAGMTAADGKDKDSAAGGDAGKLLSKGDSDD